jgi:tRNA modification GTPase
VVLQQIVTSAMHEGARLAEPGEFTLRAYLNGRIDLVQAEAVADLVDAVTPLQARAAYDQLNGTLTRVIAQIDHELFDLAARLEASLDFPEEGFHFIERSDVASALGAIARRLDDLARDGRRGRLIREGATVVIAGRPNAGKSSLFNALVGADRAIVTDVPGTTRDLLTERVDLGGLVVTLVDTAGLRDAHDAIEEEGVRRARQARDVAQLVLYVVDGSVPVADEEVAPCRGTARRLVVVSKGDAPAAWKPAEDLLAVRVSVRTGEGLDELRERIVAALIGQEPTSEAPAMSNVRHLRLVETARRSLTRARTSVAEGATEELVLAELGAARIALETIVGRRTADDVLAHIFERFCIGK